MYRDYVVLSLKGLKNRRLRSWLTMIGIFIGIAAVVSLIGLGEGLRTAIVSQFGFLGSDILSIQAAGLAIAGPPGTGAVTPLGTDLADKIAKVPGVEVAFNRWMRGGTLEFNDRQSIGFAISIPDGEERKVVYRIVNAKTEQGRLLKDGDNRKVLLGNMFTEDRQFGKGISAGDRVLINDATFEVVGILKKSGNFLMDSAVLINDQPLLDISEPDDEVSIIVVKIKDPDDVDQVRADIEKLLRKERDVKVGEEDFSVESPQQIIDSLNSALFGVQLFIYIIAGISIVVGGIGIMNTMYTAVVERTKEIGIMKAIGAQNRTIFVLFAFESGFLGSVGGGVGVIIGMLMAYGLAAAGRSALGADLIQATIGLPLIFGSLAFSFLVGMLAGVLPALQASKKNPVDAMRYAK
jgi:putative ABC transport system permease protein